MRTLFRCSQSCILLSGSSGGRASGNTILTNGFLSDAESARPESSWSLVPAEAGCCADVPPVSTVKQTSTKTRMLLKLAVSMDKAPTTLGESSRSGLRQRATRKRTLCPNMCFSSFAEWDREQKCEHDTADPKPKAFLEVLERICGIEKPRADKLAKERANDCANAERDEIHRTSGTALHAIWIDLLDDGVRNHRGPGRHAEEEGTQSNRQKGWKDDDLEHHGEHHDHAQQQHGFS